MYAVLEFLTGDQRQCAVVPLLWLVDNEKNCYWPRTKNEQSFKKLVKENTPYQSSWPKCSVHRVLETAAAYDMAVDRMNHILDTGTSGNGGLTTNAVTMKPVLSENESDIASSDCENTDVEKQRKRKHKSRKHKQPRKKRSKHRKMKEPSSAESSSTSHDREHEGSYENVPIDASANMSIRNSSLSCRTLTVLNNGQNERSPFTLSPRSGPTSSGILQNRQHDVVTIPSRNNLTNDSNRMIPSSSPGTAGTSTMNFGGVPSIDAGPSIQDTPSTRKSFQPMAGAAFQEHVLRSLDELKTNQGDANVLIARILTTMEATLEPTGKPDGFPDFPLKDLNSFNAFEELLKSEIHFKYLKNRLSSIGGICQRSSVMGMLRLLLTNELAMNFNWAGQNDKISFKKAKVMAVIMDAAKLHFKGKHSSDKFIVDAVQSWLKLAKSRYEYESRKKNTK